jgi:hypothetical protein
MCYSRTNLEMNLEPCSVQLLTLTISIAFLCFALVAEVRRRFYRGFLVDVAGILCAVLAPMPLVALTSPNIPRHFNHFVPISCMITWRKLLMFKLNIKRLLPFAHLYSILCLNKYYCLPVQLKYKKASQSERR